MKKSIIFAKKRVAGLLLISLFLFSSCQTDNRIDDINTVTEVAGYKISKLRNKNTINLLSNSFKTSANATNKSVNADVINYEDFDFEKINETVDNAGKVSYSIPNKDDANSILGAYIENDVAYFFTTEIIKNGDKDIIKYNNLAGATEMSIVINNKTQTIEVIGSQNFTAKSCGQGTMDCIGHIYTKMGWASVAGWVITAFRPEVGVAVAAGCAISRCLL